MKGVGGALGDEKVKVEGTVKQVEGEARRKVNE
jgi:hypothetical protein